MHEPPPSQADTLDPLPANSVKELAEIFDKHRERLRLMVQLCMDHRLKGRVDPSDVLQEAYIDCARRFPEYQANPSMPQFLWMRFLVGQKLVDLHRQHLAMAKEPSERYRDAAELADDLRRFMTDRPIQARRATVWERTWRLCRESFSGRHEPKLAERAR